MFDRQSQKRVALGMIHRCLFAKQQQKFNLLNLIGSPKKDRSCQSKFIITSGSNFTFIHVHKHLAMVQVPHLYRLGYYQSTRHVK